MCRVKNVSGQKCAGSKMFRVKNVPGQKWAGQKCAGSKMSGSKMRYNRNNRRRAPTALLMLQRCIELDLKKIIAIIGLFQSFSIAKIFQRFFSNLPLEKAYCGYDFFQIQFYTLLHQQCSGRSSSIIRS